MYYFIHRLNNFTGVYMNNKEFFVRVKDRLISNLKKSCANNLYYEKLLADNKVILDENFDYETFKNIPVMTKDKYKAEQEEINKVLDGKKKVRVTTSGSTGNPMVIYRSVSDNIRMNYTLNKYRNSVTENIVSKKGILFHYMYYKKILAELGDESFSFVKDSENFFRFRYFFLSEEVYKACIECINTEKPQWILGQVSFLYNFAKYIRANGGLDHQVEYVECNSEYLGAEERTVIHNIFGVNPVSMYGANEVNAIAFQCSCGNMHIMDECVFCEIEEDTKNVLVTSLNNVNTPFLRYKIGDVAEWGEDNCSCEFNGPIIKLSGFRANDYFLVDGKKKVEMWYFSEAIRMLQTQVNIKVRQFKIIQYSDGVRFILVVDNDINKAKQMIYDFLKNSVEEIFEREERVDIIYVDEILPDPVTGKFKFFLSVRDANIDDANLGF